MSLFAAACGALEAEPRVATPTPMAPGVLANAGFEDGLAGWQPLGSSSAPSASSDGHDGGSSVELTTTGDTAGVTQTVSAAAIPEYISGFVFVDRWAPEGEGAYMGLRLRAYEGPGAPALDLLLVLGGLDEPPADSAGYVFLRRGDPEEGGWQYFGVALRQALTDRSLPLPSGLTSIDITAEIHAGAGETRVRFDDLYVGSQAGNPNHPDD